MSRKIHQFLFYLVKEELHHGGCISHMNRLLISTKFCYFVIRWKPKRFYIIGKSGDFTFLMNNLKWFFFPIFNAFSHSISV